MTPVLAHAGHWLPYVVPAAVVLIAVTIATIRERRRDDEADSQGDSAAR